MPAYGEATHEEDGEREEEEGEDDVHPQVVHLHLVLAIKTNFVYQLQIIKKRTIGIEVQTVIISTC